MKTIPPSLGPTDLTRQDIIEFEPYLKSTLKTIVPSTSYTLTFPTSPPLGLAPDQEHPHGRALLEEDELLLPLAHGDKLLAIFSARGVQKKETRQALPSLPTMAALCLDHLYQYKQSITDPLTGLFNLNYLHKALVREISGVLESIMPGPGAMPDELLHGHSACFGFLLIDLDRFRRVNRNYGYQFGDTLLIAIAERLRELCPPQTLLCRMDADAFGVLWPQASSRKLLDLGHQLAQELSRITAYFAPLREQVGISASLGLVNYPQDFQGSQFQKGPEEQTHLILEKAERALHAAQACGHAQVCGFRHVLTQGGAVLDVMPMDRLLVSLGRGADAREGQRFLVWSKSLQHADATREEADADAATYPPMYKGEISLVEVREELSVAEVLYQRDPAWPLEKGDRLTLLDEHSALSETRDMPNERNTPRKDPLTGLYPYRDFLHVWQSARTREKAFCMALMRLETPHADRTPMDQLREEQFFQVVASRAADLFGAKAQGGRFSLNCIVYYIPEVSQEDCHAGVRELLDDERLADLRLTVGIAAYPFLDFPRSEILENARKALDHASMLQEERLACLDSISLTISADRLFTQGEIYDAMNEYKKALSADEHNFLARNSLGICYARMNKFATARTIFHDLTERHPEHFMPLYNYGCACLKDGDPTEARAAFEHVLRIAPDHVYALLRLGLMAEDDGAFDQAWALYERVRALPQGEQLAARYLARLAFRRGDRDSAREFLHQAITANPQDAFSFHLLAKIYLERGDDPEIAETLARQSVHLKNDAPLFWDVLIAALEQQGKTEEAQQAKIRATAQNG